MNNIKTILVATTALITSHAHAEMALKETDTGRQVYAGIQFGMGDLSVGGLQDEIVTRSTQDMYDGFRAKGYHDLHGEEGNPMFPEPLHWKAPRADISLFDRSTVSESNDGSNGRIFIGTRMGDKFGIELGMFKTKSRSTAQKFETNGVLNLKHDYGYTDPNWIIWAMENGMDVDPQDVYACRAGYESIKNYGCAGTTKVTTDAKGIDLVGSYDLLTVLSLRGGIHSSSVTSSIKQYSVASVNPIHPDYNNPDGFHRNTTETHTGFGPVMGVALKFRGFSADLTRHQDLGGVDVHSNTFNLGYTYSFGK